MIKYFFSHFFNKKTRIIILIVLLLVSILSVVISSPQTSTHEMALNANSYNLEYHGRMLIIIRYILMFTISLILMDHDAPFIKPLIAYFKRGRVSCCKLIFYFLIISWLIVVIYSIMIVIPFIVTRYYQFDWEYFIEFLKLLPDYYIMSLLLLIFLRENRKGISFLLLIVLIIISFIQEDSENLAISYLIPLSGSKIFNYKLGYYFLAIYLFFLIYLYFYVFLNENF